MSAALLHDVLPAVLGGVSSDLVGGPEAALPLQGSRRSAVQEQSACAGLCL